MNKIIITSLSQGSKIHAELTNKALAAIELLNPITVIIDEKEYLKVDKGRPILKSAFIETFDLILNFLPEASHRRTYDARTIIGDNSQSIHGFNWHTSRSVAVLARIDGFHLIIVNPKSGIKRYRLAPHVIVTKQNHKE